MTTSPREPLWVLLFVGWMVWSCGVGHSLGQRRPERAPQPEPAAVPLDAEELPARELRRLPGLGEVRALTVVRDRWRRRGTGEPLDWEALPGIGPETAERVRVALEAASDAPPRTRRPERAPFPAPLP